MSAASRPTSCGVTRLPQRNSRSPIASRNSAALWKRSSTRLASALRRIVSSSGGRSLGVLVEPIEAPVAHHQQHVEIVGGGEQAPAHDHLGQHDADREQIAAAVEHAAHHLLGRHVAVLALERAGLGLRLALLRVGDAEVAQLDVAAPGDEDVRRRDVAVDQAHGPALGVAGVVGVVERVQHLHRDEHGRWAWAAGSACWPTARSSASASKPSMNSSAMKYWPFTSPKSMTWTIFGWMSCAVSFASSMNIETKFLSAARCGRIRLMTSDLLEAVGRRDLRLEDLRHPPRRQPFGQRVPPKRRGKSFFSLRWYHLSTITRGNNRIKRPAAALCDGQARSVPCRCGLR